jgi:serine/threonine-protein kinase
MAQDADPDRTNVALADALLGSVLARRYHIEQRIAAGGFGRVYRARDLVDRRDVAVKVLHPSQADDAGVVGRFRREAAALRRLNHRHTVQMYEFGEAQGGLLFIAMELLRGESLREEFDAQGRLPWWRVIKIVRMVCSALAQAHALDIVHRDLKPENIHLEQEGDEPDFVKVVDFGIAKILRGSRAETRELTQAGIMIGTSDYMAPEQMVSGEVGAPADIFTLGVVTYEMISGLRPYGSPKTSALQLNAILTTTAPPLSSRANSPRELDPIVARCLDKDAKKRYAYADQLGADLERVMRAVPEEVDVTKTKVRAMTFGNEGPTFTSEPPTQRAEAGSDPLPSTTLPGILPPKRRR